MLNPFNYSAEEESVDNTIAHPDHYVKGRSIEPIDVIDSWGLCPYLSNVVKYISRAGRKENALLDLLKAQWYLTRKINHLKTLHQARQKIKGEKLVIEKVAEDWHLSPRLKSVLYYTQIIMSQRRKYKADAVSDLLMGLMYLRAEIKRLSQKEFMAKGDLK